MSEESTTPVVSTDEVSSSAQKQLSSAEVDKPRRARKATKAPEAVTVPEPPPVPSAPPPGGATAVLADLTVTPSPPSVDGKPRSVITTPDGITVYHY